MRSHSILRHAAVALLFSSGCFIVDDTSLKEVEAEFEPETGYDLAVETCDQAASNTSVATRITGATGTNPVRILTRTMNADSSPTLCSAVTGPAPGPDGFVRVEASAGQFWHFHVSKIVEEGADAGTGPANPVVVMYPVNAATQTCNVADCRFVSDLCDDDQEHFGIEFAANGAWVLGIDAANVPGTSTSPGAAYRIDAYQPTCGNGGDPEHGESCDDGNTAEGDGCDRRCRTEISSDASEVEVNDDPFWANRVYPSQVGVKVNGNLVNQCDHDVYAVDLAAGQTLTVYVMDASGTAPRAYGAGLPFSLRITSGTSPIGGNSAGSEVGTGFARATITSASGGSYYVRAEQPSGGSSTIPYVLRFNVSP